MYIFLFHTKVSQSFPSSPKKGTKEKKKKTQKKSENAKKK